MDLPTDKVKKLSITLKEAIEIDNYGQRMEACENYKHVQNQIHRYLNQDYCVFNDRQCHLLIKLIACINRRIDTIKNPRVANSLDANKLTEICENLENILFNLNYHFPVRISAQEFAEAIPRYLEFNEKKSEEDDIILARDFQSPMCNNRNGNLLPLPRFNLPNRTCLTLIIDRVDIKNAGSYIDPFITVSVKDKKGILCSASQNTPIALKKEEQAIIFNFEVNVQQSIESISKDDAIFLELYHYKPKKESNSLKCFSILERDEIKSGLLHLEIYKKPVDHKRKNLTLLDSNARMMHVYLHITANH